MHGWRRDRADCGVRSKVVDKAYILVRVRGCLSIALQFEIGRCGLEPLRLKRE